MLAAGERSNVLLRAPSFTDFRSGNTDENHGGTKVLKHVWTTPIVLVLFVTDANAQAPSLPQDRVSQPQSKVLLGLREEAGKLSSGHLSPLFAVVQGTQAQAELAPTGLQVELTNRVEDLSRKVLLRWLLARIDELGAEPDDDSVAQLKAQWKRLRGSVLSHSESLVLQGILTPSQTSAILNWSGRKPALVLKDRFDSEPRSVPDEQLGPDDLAEQLRRCAQRYSSGGSAGFIFIAVLGSRMLAHYTDPKTNTVPPSLMKYARQYMPSVQATRSRVDLARELNNLTVDIITAWLTHDLDKQPLPSIAILRRRLSDQRDVTASLSRHAEAIVLEAILSPAESDGCLRAMWQHQGLRCLRDPSLASRLGLSRSQREEIEDLLGEKESISDQQTQAQMSAVGMMPGDPEVRVLSERIAAEARGRQAVVDGSIVDCLTPAQAKILARIMGDEKLPQRSKARRGRRSRPG